MYAKEKEQKDKQIIDYANKTILSKTSSFVNGTPIPIIFIQ